MTDTAQPVAEYLIRKGGYYYRPNSQGYTARVEEAGRYTLSEAEEITHPNGPDGPRDGMSYEPAPAQPASDNGALCDAIYANLCAADNQDIPLEEYPSRIISVVREHTVSGDLAKRLDRNAGWRDDRYQCVTDPALLREAAESITAKDAEIAALQQRVAEPRDALKEQIAECFDGRCEMCIRHEALMNGGWADAG